MLIAGGDRDALSALGRGVPAVCSTNGEGSVPAAEHLSALHGRRVALALDSDDAGRLAAEKRLSGIASEVRDVFVPAKDVNEYFLARHTADGLRGLIASAPAVGVRRDPADLVRGALRKAADGESRNGAGCWLGCQMWDEGYSEDEAWDSALAEYQQTVETRKDDLHRAGGARVARNSSSAATRRASPVPQRFTSPSQRLAHRRFASTSTWRPRDVGRLT